MRRAMVGIVCLIACLLSGCAKKEPTVSRLEGAEPQRLSFGPPAQVQKDFTKQMQVCWFGSPAAPLGGYQYDTKPGAFEGTDGIEELPQVTIRSSPDSESFLVQFYPFNNNTLITTRNLSLPVELAAKLKRDIETWIFGRDGCGPAEASVSIAAAPAQPPQTSSAVTQQVPSGWGTSQEPAARSINRY